MDKFMCHGKKERRRRIIIIIIIIIRRNGAKGPKVFSFVVKGVKVIF
jgi:hypothetical protein